MDYVSKIHNVNKRALPYLEIENKKKIETNIKYLLLILNFLRTLDFSSHYHCFFFFNSVYPLFYKVDCKFQENTAFPMNGNITVASLYGELNM